MDKQLSFQLESRSPGKIINKAKRQDFKEPLPAKSGKEPASKEGLNPKALAQKQNPQIYRSCLNCPDQAKRERHEFLNKNNIKPNRLSENPSGKSEPSPQPATQNKQAVSAQKNLPQPANAVSWNLQSEQADIVRQTLLKQILVSEKRQRSLIERSVRVVVSELLTSRKGQPKLKALSPDRKAQEEPFSGAGSLSAPAAGPKGKDPFFDNLISVETIAEALGLAPKTIRNWVSARRIPFVRVGRKVMFRQRSFELWLNRKEVKSWL